MKFVYIVYLFTTLFASAQSILKHEIERNIPVSFLNHPEIGMHSYKDTHSESLLELIHLRTEFSKTFLNKNKTKTTVQSSTPLHYKSNEGYWLTQNHILQEFDNTFSYPSNTPNIELSKFNSSTKLFNKNLSLKVGLNKKLFFEQEGKIISTKQPIVNVPNRIENQVQFKNIFSQIDFHQNFYQDVVKTEYILNDKNIFPNNFDFLVFEEVIELTDNQKIELQNNQVIVLNEKNEIVFVIHAPIISDSRIVNKKDKSFLNTLEAVYALKKISNNQYQLQLKIDSSWLMSNNRIFPIIVDPVITIENNNVVNSCFLPNYQQNTINVSVPSGETVLSTNVEYDFIATAGTNAWMSDQRSFVSSVNGQTSVLSGVGNTAGTYTYQINNSEIGNGVSTGEVQFTFNFARNWGGSGCNATFNFVNRRVISVTYGTIEFGDGPIYINEYSASNRSHTDSFGRTEDWIEIYNSNPNTYFNLAGYYLSNRINNPTMWQITNGVIPPNSRLLVFCSNRNISSGLVQHANFNLTQLRPDEIVLTNPSGVVVESHEMFVTQTNHSYGRISDGASSWGVFNNPTPGQPNTNSFSGYTSKPTFDLAPGKYQNQVTLTLNSSGNNEQIRYTTNGSTPTINSSLYSQPFTITQTTVVRARAFSSDNTILPGFIETNSYFINENSTLPIFSFAGDADLLQLFNGNQNLEPLGNFEYFENNGVFVDENFGDFDKHGNDSWNYPQRGVDFVSRDDHGYKRRLEHKFFNTSNRTNFRRLMVKAAASDNFPFENGGAHIRDVFIQTLSQLAGLDLDERSATYVSVYVNGQYWGLYDLRERVDDNNYTNFYYNQDYTFRDSDVYLQFLKTWGSTQAHFGNQPAITAWTTLRNYVQNNDMGVQSHFNYVDGELNIDSLIDYFVINSFVVSRDWLNYNTGWWRGTNPNESAQKWRYTLWDMDAALGHYTNFTGMPNVTATASPCQVENLNVGNGHTQIIRKLIQQNPSVRQRYVTRYADLLNTHFSCDKITQVFDSIVAVIAPEIPRQIARWGGNLTTWQTNVQTARNFLTTRCAHLMNSGLANCYNLTGPFATTFQVFPANAGTIKMNSEWLTSYPFTAQVFGNIETILTVQENPGFTFSHWVVDGAVVTPNVNNPNIILQLSQATSVTAYFNPPTSADGDLLYYWHFNSLETPNDVTEIHANFSLVPNTTPKLTYTGTGPRDIDANNTGSSINLHLNESSGKSARVRNPSTNRSLIFDVPTTNYENIKFSYAVERTNQGQLVNIVAYSIDGINFTQVNLAQTEFSVDTEFSLIAIDFSNIAAVNNNPNFKIRISFQGNTTASNGNNRFDNIALKGTPISLSIDNYLVQEVQVFPNPFNEEIHFISNENIETIIVMDALGKIVSEFKSIYLKSYSIKLLNLQKGMYFVKISTENNTKSFKLIKN